MHLLFETPVGYALFKVDKSRFVRAQGWADLPQDAGRLAEMVQLEAFRPFADARDSLQASVKAVHGKLSSVLSEFIREGVGAKDTLLVGEKRVAAEIAKKLNLPCISDEKVTELTRAVRSSVTELLGECFRPEEARNMSLGLAHGLGRFRVKFSAEKVDTMVVQAVSLLEDLDKEINNYLMRLREWYGYHFPEMARVVPDGVVYAKVVAAVGNRQNAAKAQLDELLPEETRRELAQAAEISIGTDVSEADERFIKALAAQVLELDAYRGSLEEYLRTRMLSVAPNLAALVGEVVAAKLIAKAGSLVSLAKMSGSTLQIIGAEKALFKAMRARKKTPKYGIIYQTRLVSGATGRAKARIARALAAKSALCVRFDALNEEESAGLGAESLAYLEKRLHYLETVDNVPATAAPTAREHRAPLASKPYAARADFSRSDAALQKRDKEPAAAFQNDKKVKTR